MKIALFQDVDADPGYGQRIGDLTCEDDGYIRISGYIDVDFPPLEPEGLERQLTEIDIVRSSRERRHNEISQLIEQRRAALTKQSSGS